MTTTKPPVLTDDERELRLNQLINDFAIACAFGDDSAKRSAAGFALREHFRAIEQAVLERAGADALRDAALEEAIKAVESVIWSVGNSAAGELAAELTGRSMSEARDAIRALKVTPAAAVADAQPVAWPEADAENAAIGWTLDFKFVEQVREVAAMGYGFSAGQEEAEAILMAALSVHPLYAAPQAGQLSGNAGEVDDDEDLIADIIAIHAFHDIEHGNACMNKWQMRDAAKDILAHFAAIAASKGAKP